MLNADSVVVERLSDRLGQAVRRAHAIRRVRRGPASVIDDLKLLFLQHPGAAEVVLKLDTSDGPRCLLFGPEFKVKPTPDLRVELDGILGPAASRPTAGPDDELAERPAVAAPSEPQMA